MSEDVIPWRTDAELEDADREANEMLAATKHAEKVSEKVRDLRVLEDARARLRAEKVADTNFAEQFLTPAQLRDMPRPDPLISKVLPRHTYAILRGRDHSLKSFLAIDWSLCLATGKPWQDHQVEQTRVLYIAGEGAHGLAGRIEAWEYAWQERVPEDQFTIRQTALNLHQPGPAFDHLLDHVAAGSYGLVIVDTLRRVSGAADGNTSEMGLVVDNLDLVKQATDRGSVLVVAHTDKGDHDSRGYSGIEDDADVVWSAKRNDMLLDLELKKMKDGPDGRKLTLLAQPALGSLVLAGTDGTPAIDTNESQQQILEALNIMPPGGVTGPELMATAELKKPTFYRALNALVEQQHVVTTKNGRTRYYELPGLPDDDTETSAETDDHPTLDQEDQ
jgi:hypothetical protein